MGVDTRIKLPVDTQLDDVADVMGVLAGLKPEKRGLGTSDGSWYVKVPGAEAKSSTVPEMAMISLSGQMIDGQKEHSAYYHFEFEPPSKPGPTVSVRATPFWIAVGIGLVKFFGGSIDFQDCDESDWDLTKKRPRRINNPSDGPEWQRFQDAILNVKPLTKADLKAAGKHAAYK